MAIRRLALHTVAGFVLCVAAASAAQGVQPKPGAVLTGRIEFPRAQQAAVHVDPARASRLTAYLGFYGRCTGGGLNALWASNVAAKPVVRVRNGRFSATLTATTRNLAGAGGRTAKFRWRFAGRFVASDVVTATVSGTAEVRARGRTVSRCRIAKPAPVRFTASA